MSPEMTAVVFLGAWRFQRMSDWTNKAFLKSKADLENYLRRAAPAGLGVSAEYFLDLFNKPIDAPGQLREIGHFLDQLKEDHPDTVRNLVIHYVGHGYFAGTGREYCLALVNTEEAYPDTGLRLTSLSAVLKDRARSFRFFYLLDCCFSGQALREAMGPVDEKVEAALRADTPPSRMRDEMPRRGTAVLCATSADDLAMAHEGSTVFGDALVEVLTQGDRETGESMTLQDVRDLMWERIRIKHQSEPKYQVRPYLGSPNQSDGDVATKVALFPNPASRRPEPESPPMPPPLRPQSPPLQVRPATSPAPPDGEISPTEETPSSPETSRERTAGLRAPQSPGAPTGLSEVGNAEVRADPVQQPFRGPDDGRAGPPQAQPAPLRAGFPGARGEGIRPAGRHSGAGRVGKLPIPKWMLGAAVALILAVSLYALIPSRSGEDSAVSTRTSGESSSTSSEPRSAEPAVESFAGHRVGETFSDCTECPQMVVVPSGSFLMGSPASEEGGQDSEKPVHTVHIGYAFAAGKYLVTRAEWRKFVKDTSRRSDAVCNWENPGFTQGDDHPVVCISWEDATAYAQWLSQKTGDHYRLLSEAQYEYVNRAGTAAPYFWGSSAADMCRYANGGVTSVCKSEYTHTSPVGHFLPNKFKLYDTTGNIWEWVQDCWHDNYKDAPSDGRAWGDAANCSSRVVRGGSWNDFDFPSWFRSAYRNSRDGRIDNVGFRVARTYGVKL